MSPHPADILVRIYGNFAVLLVNKYMVCDDGLVGFVASNSQCAEHQRPRGKCYCVKSTVFVFRSGFLKCHFSDRTIFLQALTSFGILKLCF